MSPRIVRKNCHLHRRTEKALVGFAVVVWVSKSVILRDRGRTRMTVRINTIGILVDWILRLVHKLTNKKRQEIVIRETHLDWPPTCRGREKGPAGMNTN